MTNLDVKGMGKSFPFFRATVGSVASLRWQISGVSYGVT